jgi:hypothetical protein
MRRRVHTPVTQPGVQRLAADESDDRSFAWQDRSEERSPSQTRSALGLFGGYSWRSGSVGDRALRREDEQWRRDFEREHRDDLLATRREHFEEIVERRLELKRARAPEDERERVELSRRDVIAAREQLDRDMPFEFELPATVDLYPGDLPEPGPEDDESAGADTESDEGPGAAPMRRPPVSAAPGSSASSAASRPGAPTAPSLRRRGGRGGATSAGSETSESGFDWQQREPTDQQAVTAMFGGGLFGDLLGMAVGEETDDDRRAAEAERLPELNTERQARERELRHRMLREKLRVRETEARREERDAPSSPVSLTDEEITGIRERIDRDMPLEFAVPTYLDPDIGVTIDSTGQITDGRPAAEPAAESDADAGEVEPAADVVTDISPAPPSDVDHAEADVDTAVDTGGAVVDSGPARGTTTAGSLMAAATLARAADDVIRDDDADEPDTGAAAAVLLSSASDHDVDVLSRRIWSRIRREMRSELLVDRERAGALADHR